MKKRFVKKSWRQDNRPSVQAEYAVIENHSRIGGI